jgi:hypothetical protein
MAQVFSISKKTGRPFGVAVIMAILVAMISFTSATILALRIRHDLATADLGAQQASRRMAVKGAVNHLLSMLRRGEGTEYVSSSPLSVTIGGVEDVKVWTEPDAIFPDISHIRAELGGISFTKSVKAEPVRDSKVFFESNNQIFSQEPGDLTWNSIPSPPSIVYDMFGQPQTLLLHPAGLGEIQDLEASHDGKVLATVFTSNGGNSLQGVHLWDDESQTWSTLPPIQGFYYDTYGLQFRSTYEAAQIDGMSEGKIYSLTSGGLAVYDTNQQQWSHYPPPAIGERGHFSSAGGGKLAVDMTQNANRWVSVFKNGSWSTLSLPPNSSLTPRGINRDGDVYGTQQDAVTQKWTTKVYSNGTWQSVAPPPQLDGLELRAVDAAGGLVFNDGTKDLIVWNEGDSTVDSSTVPPSTTLYGSQGSEGRQLAGGGKEVIGALPELKVVSSF